MAAGGCIGSLAIIVPDNELNSIISEHLTGERKLQHIKSFKREFLCIRSLC